METLTNQKESAKSDTNSASHTLGSMITLSVDDIDLTRFSSRDVDLTHVKSIQDAMTENVSFPRISVAQVDGCYLLIDGRHRLEAMRNLKKTMVEVELLSFSCPTDLVVTAITKNHHGKPLSVTQKRDAFFKFHDHLGEKSRSIQFLARTFAVSRNTIKCWKKLLARGGQFDHPQKTRGAGGPTNRPADIPVPHSVIVRSGDVIQPPDDIFKAYDGDFIALLIPSSYQGKSLKVVCAEQTFFWEAGH